MTKTKLTTKCGKFNLFLTINTGNGYIYCREYSKEAGTSVKRRISKSTYNEIINELLATK